MVGVHVQYWLHHNTIYSSLIQDQKSKQISRNLSSESSLMCVTGLCLLMHTHGAKWLVQLLLSCIKNGFLKQDTTFTFITLLKYVLQWTALLLEHYFHWNKQKLYLALLWISLQFLPLSCGQLTPKTVHITFLALRLVSLPKRPLPLRFHFKLPPKFATGNTSGLL